MLKHFILNFNLYIHQMELTLDWKLNNMYIRNQPTWHRTSFCSTECKYLSWKMKLILALFSYFRDGASLCGVFCAVYNAIQQLTMDNEVDVFSIVRQLQIRRPELCSSLVIFFNTVVLGKNKSTNVSFFLTFVNRKKIS